MKNIRPILYTLCLLGMTACGPRERKVENPYFESANSINMDIRKVEINDTATIVHLDVYERPKAYIAFRSEWYLQADGKQYALRRVEGAQVNHKFQMPESGQASYKIIFDPIPKNAISFDLKEGNVLSDYNIYGVDLTGSKKFTVPKEIPTEVLKAQVSCPYSLPVPEYKIGETTVNLHLLNRKSKNRPSVTLYANTITSNQEKYTATKYRSANEAEVKFWQFGPVRALIQVGEHFLGSIWLKAGENIDVYLDMNVNAFRILKQREVRKGVKCPIYNIYSTGAYAWMSRLHTPENNKYFFNVNDREYTDPRRLADDYTENIVKQYHALTDSINKSGLTGIEKQMALVNMKQSIVAATAYGNSFIFDQSISKKFKGKIKPEELTYMQPQHYAAVASLFDVSDPLLIWGQDWEWYPSSFRNGGEHRTLWPKSAHTEQTILSIIRKHYKYVRKLESGTPLTENEINKVKSINNAFVREMLLKKNELLQQALKK